MTADLGPATLVWWRFRPKVFPMVAAFKQNDLFRGLQNNLSRYNACVGNNGGPYDL